MHTLLELLTKQRLVLLAVAVCAAIGAGSWAVAQSQETSGAPVFLGARADAPEDPPMTKAVSDGQRSLSVLRRDRSAADEMPADAVARLTAHSTPLGGNPMLARQALTTETGLRYYVVPATKGVCLHSETGSGACTSLAAVQAGRFVGVEMCQSKMPKDGIRITGMMPDGVGSVVARYASGADRRVPVVENVYSFDTPMRGDLPVSIEWTIDGARGATRIGVPGDVAGGCGAPQPAR